MKNTIYELQKKLKESNIEFIFSGIFSQGLIEELGAALKQRLQDQQAAKNKISSVFFIFIEQTQNIKQYEMAKQNTKDFPVVSGSGVIAISSIELGYCVNSGNIILNDDIPELRRQLDKIASMNETELNSYYKEVSRREIDMAHNRAGLGLIQIARKATGKMEYQFERINGDYSYYVLTVTV